MKKHLTTIIAPEGVEFPEGPSGTLGGEPAYVVWVWVHNSREILSDGDTRIGVEVYPRDADLVDQANIYHLWVLPLGFELPFGLHEGAASGQGHRTEPHRAPPAQREEG